MEGIAAYVQALGEAVVWMGIALLILGPLGLWKLIEILVWMVQHLRWVT